MRTQRIGRWLVMVLVVVAWQGRGQSTDLPYSTPAAEGISPTGIVNFLDAIGKGTNEIHSFVIVRHGKIVSQGWWNPYNKDLKHTMFSVSKSFASMGIGLALSENKLKLSDKVTSFFPQSLPDTISAFMKGMTVEDLLMMSTGMETDPVFQAMQGSKDWPKTFFSTKIEHKPGTVFKYNNMASFMLSAVVQKATGEKLFDYLKPRLFEPLGIRDVTWEELPSGYTQGFIGLRLRSLDMAKVGQMWLQKGKWQGKQIIPESWVAAVSSAHIESGDPNNKMPKDLNDWAQGYGYQFWRCRHNAFRADGLGGQFIIVMPEKDAVIVLTASSLNTQEELNVVWDHLLPAMQDKPLPEDKNAMEELKKRISNLTISPTTSPDPKVLSVQKKISGKRIQLSTNDWGMQAISPIWRNGTVQIAFERDQATYAFTAGMDKWNQGESALSALIAAAPKRTQPVKFSSKCTWMDASTLEWSVKFVEEAIGTETWLLHFDESVRVRIEMKQMPAGMPFSRPPVMLEGTIQ